MPAQTKDPPALDHLAFKWFHDRWNALTEWCKNNRPVAGLGVTLSDAPGGGQRIDVDFRAVASASAARKFALEPYRSPYTGAGDPPENQGLRIKIRRGFVKTLEPENIGNEFLLTDNTATVVFYRCTFTAGVLTTVAIETGVSLPADPVGSLNTPPTSSCRALGYVTTAGGKVTEIVYDGQGSRDVTAIVTDYECGEELLAYFHSPTRVDVTTATIQDILSRLDALEV